MPPPRRWNIDPAGAPGRYPVLDALRAVAIMLVLLRHWSVAAHAAFGAPAGGPLAMLCANGWLGVDLFFVLSGFLIVNHFVGAGAGAMRIDRHAILEFYRRRAFRTLPLYWAVIALCWIAGGYGAGPVFSVGTFSTYLLFLQDYLGSDLLVTLWSLAVEEKFYLIAPALAALLMLAGRRVGGATLIALMAWVFWSMLGATRAVAASVAFLLLRGRLAVLTQQQRLARARRLAPDLLGDRGIVRPVRAAGRQRPGREPRPAGIRRGTLLAADREAILRTLSGALFPARAGHHGQPRAAAAAHAGAAGAGQRGLPDPLSVDVVALRMALARGGGAAILAAQGPPPRGRPGAGLISAVRTVFDATQRPPSAAA